MTSENERNHWTHRLFVENAHLYLPFLEDLVERASDETEALVGLFDEMGIPKGGNVLDVACGIGRHSVALAQRGYRVTGVDLSLLYVQRARERAEAAGAEVRFVQGDARQCEAVVGDGAPFDAIINMFTSHGYYGRDGDADVFAQLRRLASPEATLVVLTANRDWIIKDFQPMGLEKAGDIRIFQQRRLDLETSTLFNTWQFFKGQGRDLTLELSLDMDHRIYSLHELRVLLMECEWRYVRGLGTLEGDEFRLGPLNADSRAMWLVARASRHGVM